MIKLNGSIIKFDKFPNGETLFNLRKTLILDNNLIIYKYTGDQSLIHLMLLRQEISYYRPLASCVLKILYMPYSRMDRSQEGVSFTLKHLSNFINNLEFTRVVILEPHSKTTLDLVDRSVKNEVSIPLVDKAITSGYINFNEDEDFVVFPDDGARANFMESWYKKHRSAYLCCRKVREFSTGQIKDIVLKTKGQDLKGKRAIILDDLCSKGGTFLWTAKLLKEQGIAHVTLVVAHCEQHVFSGNLNASTLIDKVITTNSILDYTDLASAEKFICYNSEDM